MCRGIRSFVCIQINVNKMFRSKFLKNSFNLFKSVNRRTAQKRFLTILGIETSFDDTGCAIVTEDGRILGEALNSQSLIHLRNGGTIPPIAQDLHKQYMEKVVNKALEDSGKSFFEIDAFAATVKPGLSLSLLVGARYGQKLAKDYKKPFIPIHHMEAHALSIRMVQKVEFPFLVLLISGGHCLLAVAQDVNKFLLLGRQLDDSPGEAFDKVSRRLKMTNLPEYRYMSGGQAMEKAAVGGDPRAFQFTPIKVQDRDCHFSFSGMKAQAKRHIIREEKEHEVGADGIIPNLKDMCASFQLAVARHMCQRVQRGIEYIELRKMIPPERRNLVIAGGVACNKYICRLLKHVSSHFGYETAVPPPVLCTDNGVMIAWNGVEKFQQNLDIAPPELAHTIDVEARCDFGEDHSEELKKAEIKCEWIKLRPPLIDTTPVDEQEESESKILE